MIRAKTTDNPFLPEGFIDSLLQNYPEQLIQSYLNGVFVNLNTGQVYDRFDRAKHVIEAAPVNLDNEPRHWGCDFNIGNCNAVCGVRLGNSFLLIDEVKAHDTDAMAKAIKERSAHLQVPVYVYPDSSGGNRSTNAATTDIELLRMAGLSVVASKSNPLIRDRVAAVQALLENGKGEVRLGCLRSAKDDQCLELQRYSSAILSAGQGRWVRPFNRRARIRLGSIQPATRPGRAWHRNPCLLTSNYWKGLAVYSSALVALSVLATSAPWTTNQAFMNMADH